MRIGLFGTLLSLSLLAGCSPFWQSSVPKVRPLAAAELGCAADQLDLRAVDPNESFSPITVGGCGKSATYIFAAGAGYVLSSVRNGTDVALRKQQAQ